LTGVTHLLNTNWQEYVVSVIYTDVIVYVSIFIPVCVWENAKKFQISFSNRLLYLICCLT
jgi:hypothetical protein